MKGDNYIEVKKPKFRIGQEVWLLNDRLPTVAVVVGLRLDIKEYHKISKADIKYLTTEVGKEYKEEEIYSTREELFDYLNAEADKRLDAWRAKYIYSKKPLEIKQID